MESIHNFRDFGGYATPHGVVRKGLLYRSGSLGQASPNDLQAISALGIRTIVDLRSQAERERQPDRLPSNARVEYIHLPVGVKQFNQLSLTRQIFAILFGRERRADFTETISEAYREYVSSFRAEFAQVMHLAAEAGRLPLLIHCTAGKDRTGFGSSLILLALGVTPEQVMHEYLLSNNHLHGFREGILRQIKLFKFLGVTAHRFLPLLEARREYLEAALGQVRQEYGTLEAYLRVGLGVSSEEHQKMGHLLGELA
jgi:protein-tyrosine phosphatase